VEKETKRKDAIEIIDFARLRKSSWVGSVKHSLESWKDWSSKKENRYS